MQSRYKEVISRMSSQAYNKFCALFIYEHFVVIKHMHIQYKQTYKSVLYMHIRFGNFYFIIFCIRPTFFGTNLLCLAHERKKNVIF